LLYKKSLLAEIIIVGGTGNSEQEDWELE